MDAAFVLVLAKRPGVHLTDRVPSTAPPAVLGFPARHRLDRTTAEGAVHLTAWHAEPERDLGAWYERDGDVAFLAGHVRWRGESWEPASGWAEHLAREAPPRSLDELQDELRGIFAVGLLTDGGDGWVMTDVLGLRCLYWAEDDEVLAVSSRAALVAHALSPGSTPPRDAGTASWLVFTGHHLGDRTGYTGVRVVAPGARLRLQAGTPVWEQTQPLVVARDDELRRRSVGELAEIVQEDVAEALRAVLTHPAERHVIRLTGGKDSRLLLAVAVRAGMAEAFTYETVGPPDLADVRIAAGLCEALGLRHETPFLGLGHSEPFADRFRGFVERTASLVSGWDMNTPTGSPDLRLTGLCGEPLRRYVQIRDDQLGLDALPRAFPRRAYGRLGLLRRDLADGLHAEMLDLLATQPHPDTDPRDRVHALYAGGRMRFTRLGPREEIVGDRRVQPLYSRTTVRAAMAMDPADRTAELLFAEVMKQASSLLVEHPFTDAGWDARAQAHLGLAAPVPVTTEPARPAASARASGTHATPLMSSIYAAGADERVELLREVLADAANPAWDVLDRDIAVDALARYRELTNVQRYELFGAATAAVWLER